ncbi:ciliary microtubule inner protein 5-like [Styela clava]
MAEKASGQKPVTSGKRKDTVDHNEVAQNKIWRERVEGEWKGVGVWEKNWGFLKDYDPRGRPKTPRELPEREPVFSDDLPNTKGHEYGSRITTDIGQKMTDMEYLFDCNVRKRRMGTEFVCY